MLQDDFTPSTPGLLANNARYADEARDQAVPGEPQRRIAIVACMDCRVDVTAILGLVPGDAHVLRNAGGVLTDDVIRSLCLSQRYLGTREILVMQHTDCGLSKVTEQSFRSEIESAVGSVPAWSVEAFVDPKANVLRSMQRLRDCPFLPHTDHIRGFVYDVEDRRLHEVPDPTSTPA